MKGKIITKEIIEKFKTHLCEEEKSENTKEKYIRDVRAFAEYVGDKEITKEIVIAYKQNLIDSDYAVKSINSMLASIRLRNICAIWNGYLHG